jgi:lipopolysaccharide/colanic/teichoic acid biosynthesis glycosyltransferase
MELFYKKCALGKNGKPIDVYKIRTMVPNAMNYFKSYSERMELTVVEK